MDNTHLEFAALRERLDAHKDTRMTEAAFKEAFPEIAYDWNDRALHGEQPFMIHEKNIFGLYNNGGESFSVLRLVSFEKGLEKTFSERSWV